MRVQVAVLEVLLGYPASSWLARRLKIWLFVTRRVFVTELGPTNRCTNL